MGTTIRFLLEDRRGRRVYALLDNEELAVDLEHMDDVVDEGERVLAACKAKNVGTTIMKSATGLVEMPVLDFENPSEQVQEWFEYLEGQGSTHEEAEERIKRYLEREHDNFADSVARSKPFIEKHRIKTQDELELKSFQWVLGNPDAHTICPSMPNFDALDRILPLSGTQL